MNPDSTSGANFPKRFFDAHRCDESELVASLCDGATLGSDADNRVQDLAYRLVQGVRENRTAKGGLDAFLMEYGLSNEEGVVLMCLAEALLRIPDSETADALIKDKLGSAEWDRHLGQSESFFVNASTWALMLTGHVISLGDIEGDGWNQAISRTINRVGEGVIRTAVTQAMRIMGHQFVMGRTIQEAVKRSRSEGEGYRFSFDMLGEAALTAQDAERYRSAYEEAIEVVASTATDTDISARPSVSVKLSALHPRYEYAQRHRVMTELVPTLASLCRRAARHNLGLTVDAEEADRLELSLDVFEQIAGDEDLAGWNGLGLAVQAYQKRAGAVIDWLDEIARRARRKLMVRLVKGAYWDTEIKHAQELGFDGYPVFTRKASSDVSYLACARQLLENSESFYPQFATHNAHSVAAVVEMGIGKAFEFQRLHGMGEALYEQVIDPGSLALPCRVYAPVGSHEDLLAYLVRRLLENGANSSFVNRIVDEDEPIEAIIADPVLKMRKLDDAAHPKIPLPEAIFSNRRNSAGIDLVQSRNFNRLLASVNQALDLAAQKARDGSSQGSGGLSRAILDPTDNRRVVGYICDTPDAGISDAVQLAASAAPGWSRTSPDHRAECLERISDLLEDHSAELIALAVREAGKTFPDAVAEVREAVDFCRYYAVQCRELFGNARHLQGATGEENTLTLHGRGVFLCISPWNFPLAIFTGQVSAALAAGNAVIAKPAEQTPLIATRAVQLMHEAGIPSDVLHCLPGDGSRVGARLVSDERIDGIAFTGSTATARLINQALAARDGPIVPLIAETGGINAMIVDSSALPEQVVTDVITSAFQSAGQRCSALRVLCVQDDIAERIIDMLRGAMAELVVGDPLDLATDVGPVIDEAALKEFSAYADRMDREARLIFRTKLPESCRFGTFFPPTAYEIDGVSVLEREIFGPILHVVRFQSENIDHLVDEINASGFGLTLGIHTRIQQTADRIRRRAQVGNIYVNRNQIGAMVGVQPFGGEGLSGTGPKAGGPLYLPRFATERTYTVNTTAQGGNAALLSLEGDDLDL